MKFVLNWGSAALVGVFAGAAMLRVWQMRESLWLDELHTAWVVSAPLGEVAARARIGNQSPLYFWLVALVRGLLQDCELAVRLPSLVAGLAIVPLAAKITLRWTGSWAAAVAVAGLAALDHHGIFYSQEARPYALVQLTALWQVFEFWKLQRRPTGSRRIIVVALGAILFWLHFTAGLLFAAELLWYWWLAARRQTEFTPRMLAVDAAGLTICMLPAIPHLLEISQRRDQWTFVEQSAPWLAVRWFSLVPHTAIPAVCVGLAALARRGAGGALRPPPTDLWMLTVCWFGIPVAAAWLLTWLDVVRLFFPRYLVAAVLAPIFVGGFCVASLPGKVLRGSVAAATLLLATADSGIVDQYFADGRFLAERNEDWRGAIEWLNRQPVAAATPLFVRSGLIEADRLGPGSAARLREYCVLPVRGCYQLSGSLQPFPLPTRNRILLTKAESEQLLAGRAAWLLINGKGSWSRTISEFQHAASQRGVELDVHQERPFGNINVVYLGKKLD